MLWAHAISILELSGNTFPALPDVNKNNLASVAEPLVERGCVCRSSAPAGAKSSVSSLLFQTIPVRS